MKNLRKIFASAMVTAMLATMGVSAFATPSVPKGMQEIGEKYGLTVEYVGEIDGLPAYEFQGEKVEDVRELIEKEYSQPQTRATCKHVWFYYWDASRENCIRNPNNSHTFAIKRKECSQCGYRLNTGEWEIRNCPSGCRKSDYA